MQKNHISKILAIGIIGLFIGVGIHPAFAVEDKTSVSENENPTNTDEEILENTNCFVMGINRNSLVISDFDILECLYLNGLITFGYCYKFGNICPAEGWIYTRNNVNKWDYRGHFQGANGDIEGCIWGADAYFKIGIKDFIGFAFRKRAEYPEDNIVMYIGFAETVRIKVDEG